MTTTALVTGASGYVGSRLVSALHRGGARVVATGRSTDSLSELDWPEDVTRAALDVSDADSCREALASAGHVDVLYYLVHVVGADDFAAKDLASARTLAQAAQEAGVGRIVYLGGLVPDGEELSEHLRSRAAVGTELGSHGVDLVWLRAAIILGAGSTSYEFVRQLVDRLSVVVPLPRWMDAAVQPIAIDDVLAYLVAAGTDRVPPGAYDVAGPDTLTYASLVRQYAELAGLNRRLLRVRGVTPAMAAPVVARLTAVPTPMVQDLVHSMVNDMEADDADIRGLLADVADGLTTVRDALVRAGTDARPRGVHASDDALHLATTDPDWARG
ncbi:NAD-dependent epimerase/dehydratase family protein [Solicola sp. PLA-1-18]|uniref:NAD-dependent epimerase/dehydratase family protein n=1 Tax=Solicola sp. PLA-1-18 TaxID=3380532 RepID=UPI003B7E6472